MASVSAAASARLTSAPVATMVSADPLRRMSARPNAKAFDSSGVTEGTFVRPILR